MEFVNNPSQGDSDRPDYAKMRGPVNCQRLTVTELTSGIGSEGGGGPAFLRKEPCVQAEEIYPEKIGPPVINQSVPNTKVKAAAARVETARKEEIKAQADEPIQKERNGVTTESEEREEENEGQAGTKEAWLLGMLVKGFWLLVATGGLLGMPDQGFLLLVAAGWLLGMLDQGFLLLVAAGWSLVRLVQGFFLLVAAALRLIKVAKFKFVLNLGVIKIEIHVEI